MTTQERARTHAQTRTCQHAALPVRSNKDMRGRAALTAWLRPAAERDSIARFVPQIQILRERKRLARNGGLRGDNWDRAAASLASGMARYARICKLALDLRADIPTGRREGERPRQRKKIECVIWSLPPSWGSRVRRGFRNLWSCFMKTFTASPFTLARNKMNYADDFSCTELLSLLRGEGVTHLAYC